MQTLIYLRDFDHWFRQLPLRLPGVGRQAFEHLRVALFESLQDVVKVIPKDLVELRSTTSRSSREGEFLLTLDGGTYFQNFDFSFAMTRSVTRLRDVLGGRTIRIAREGSGQFWTQVDALREAYDSSGKQSIVLCDDGIDTGKSVAEVIRQLSNQYLDVRVVRVLLNPNGIRGVEGVPVESIESAECSAEASPALWTHERDLFWGSPGGGVSLCSKTCINVLRGVPYSLTSELLRRRLGIEADVSGLRKQLLEVNVKFWAMLSQAAGRELRVKDVPRLLWVTELAAFPSDLVPIEEVLRWLMDNEPDLT